jgi:hypothetical protein
MLAGFEDVLDRLNVASRNGERAMCFCPAHDDRNNPSLSIKAESGTLLLHCFAGCHPEDVVSEMGLDMKDLFAEGGGGSSIPPRTPARLHAQDGKAHTNGQNGRARYDARFGHGCTLGLRREDAAGGFLARLGPKRRKLLGQACHPHPLSQ